MRAGNYLGNDANRNVSLLAYGSCDAGHLIQFKERVNVYREYSIFDCVPYFVIGLGDPVKHYLIGAKAYLLCLVQLSSGVDLDIASGAAHSIEHRHVRVCFGCVTDFRERMDGLDGVAQVPDVIQNSSLGEHIQRSSVLLG